jgi:predicted nucleic-acid-binding protein
MRRRYGATRSQLIEVLERLLNSPELILESHSAVTQALQRFAGAKADFADCLIERCGHLAGCSHTVTFDVNASESAGMKLL